MNVLLFFVLLTSALSAPVLDGASDSVAVRDTAKVILSLEDALKVAMSENISVKIADKEVVRTEYARKGSYAALYPQIDATASYQRTIKKQVTYMDIDMSKFLPSGSGSGSNDSDSGSMADGFEVGRYNNVNLGANLTMPIINAALWENLKISKDAVELSVEKARASRLSMVTEVKSAFYSVLWAKEALNVYNKVYENAVKTLKVTEMKYAAQKTSQVDVLRARTTVASSIPDIIRTQYAVDLALYRLKAVMGVDLEYNMDVQGALGDYAKEMFYDIHSNDNFDLKANTSLRQLSLQIEQLSKSVKANQYAYIPSLGLAFNYSYMCSANDVNFSEWKWNPYSYVGLSLSIPIFSGMKRYNAVKQSKIQLQQAELQKINTERQLRIAVKNTLGTMETGMKSYYASQAAVEAAKKAYDIAEASYNVGRITLLELNASLLALSESELSQWQAIHTFLTAKSELEEQLGRDYTAE